jgi:hypothetical protein
MVAAAVLTAAPGRAVGRKTLPRLLIFLDFLARPAATNVSVTMFPQKGFIWAR